MKRIVWIIVLLFLTLAWLGVVGKLWLDRSDLSQKAFDAGQVMVLHLYSGKVEGKIAQSNEEPVPTPPPPPAAIEAAPVAVETPKPLKEAAPKIKEDAKTEEQAEPSEASPVNEMDSSAENTSKDILKEITPKSLPTASTDPVAAIQVHTPLTNQPNKAFYQSGRYGKLPIISDDGREPWRYYAKPDTSEDDAKVIALIVTGLGMDRDATTQALALPEEVALSFSPYAPELDRQLTRARSAGHEVWLDAPMQPEDYPASDAGTLALMKNMTQEEMDKVLQPLLGKAVGYVGFVAPRAESFTGYNGMEYIAAQLKSRGLLLVLRGDAFTPTDTASHTLAVTRQLDLSMVDMAAPPDQMLEELAAMATQHGHTLGVTSPAPRVMHHITQFTKEMKQRNLTLVPPSALIRHRE